VSAGPPERRGVKLKLAGVGHRVLKPRKRRGGKERGGTIVVWLPIWNKKGITVKKRLFRGRGSSGITWKGMITRRVVLKTRRFGPKGRRSALSHVKGGEEQISRITGGKGQGRRGTI